jgi:cytochrome P450
MNYAKSEADGPYPRGVDEIDFRRGDVQNCPFPAYAMLRDEAPVWQDPQGQYQVTRYDLLRQVLRDTENFSTHGSTDVAEPDQERVARIRKLYEEKGGWAPTPSILLLEDPDHKYMRQLFEKILRAGKVKDMGAMISELGNGLIDDFIAAGACEWVRQFAAPLPLIVILRQSGIPTDEMWKLKAWTDAWVRHHLSFMQNEDEARASVEMEIERQRYFQPIFERLREHPNDSFLSDLANTVIPEWGRRLSDAQLHTAVGADILVGGAETTTNALSAGMKLLIENPDVWERLKADPEAHLRIFVEEVLRLESPAQALYRVALNDVELGGVKIPKGASIALRFGAANRDERQFACPDKLDLDRANSATHVTFGAGLHTCVGAPLSRRELYLGFQRVVERFKSVRFAEGKNDFSYEPSKSLRALRALHIEFEPA